jgi:hypothetical protein
MVDNNYGDSIGNYVSKKVVILTNEEVVVIVVVS